MDHSQTTRRYPRTLYGADGAYTHSAEYCAALTIPTRIREARRVVRFAWRVALLAIYVATLVWGLA